MRVLFMGTPDIAAAALKRLLDDGFEIVGAVTQPDRPKGRGQKLAPPEVKVLAQESEIPVFQPERLKNGELNSVLQQTRPDVIAVVAYGRILPKYVLDYPPLGCVNMHASLLPKYRGAAPVQWSVINGDAVTGVTTMKMDEGLDTGDILLSESLEIGRYETAGELFERISVLGAEVLSRTLATLTKIVPKPQPTEGASYAPMLDKELARIDWDKPAAVIAKKICGMNPWPLAYTTYNGEIMKIITAYAEDKTCGACGEVLENEKGKGIRVGCKEGTLCIRVLQFPGKRKMDTDEYLLGHSIEVGSVLG